MKEINLKESFGTLSETINGLSELGYTHDFNVQQDFKLSNHGDIKLSPKDFQIDKVYRFEGATNPDDQAILYAISSEKFEIRGILVNGYGISDDEATSEIIEKLETHSETGTEEIKSNEATPQRPEGDRILNAPLVEMDVNKFLEQIRSEPSWADSDRNSITIFKSESLRIVLMGLHENAELKEHKANGVISVQVLEGEINFITDQQTVQIGKGQMIALQENILHSVKALKESFFLLTLAMNSR